VKRLSGVDELLDGELDAHTLEGNLRDLARVNALLDGAGLSWRALRPHFTNGKPLRVLDVGTGGADIPRALVSAARRANANLEMVATDVRPEIVAFAWQTAAAEPSFEVLLAPADRIDEPDDSYDVVHASLVLHHLEPAACVALLKEMARVAAEAVIVNDLDRGRHWLLIARVMSRLMTRNRYTRNDAPLSVQRAYRPNEIAQMAARAGLVEANRQWAWPRYRYALTFRHAESTE
jgi:ubiquinone/menaquinone biosynthesis C-methylase UbiE